MKSTTKLIEASLGQTTLLLAIILSILSAKTSLATTSSVKDSDLIANGLQAKQQQHLNETSKQQQQQQQQKDTSFNVDQINSEKERTTSGRSMESAVGGGGGGQQPRQSSRGGRMLDLDHLAGDIGKKEKVAKERSLSGERQSRILNEDLPLNQQGSSKVDARNSGFGNNNNNNNRKSAAKGKKKMSIKGFIPIVSLDGAKEGKDFNVEDDDDDDSSGDSNLDNQDLQSSQESADGSSNTRDQLLSNYGGQTSIGHASFNYQPSNGQQQQQQQLGQSQWQQVGAGGQQQQQQATDLLLEAGRANRKLSLGSGVGGGILSGLAGLGGHKRFMSALVPQQHQFQSINHQQIQGPMNLPPTTHQHISSFGGSSEGDCICVPFFQCKNGYLSESQLSKSQLEQIFQANQQQAGFVSAATTTTTTTTNPHQVPRALNFNQQQQELYYTPAGNQQQQQQQQQPQISSLMSQLVGQQRPTTNLNKANEQQMVNDIYDQLRKNIENEQLEQQLQQQQQQPIFNNNNNNNNWQQLDERSKQSDGNVTITSDSNTQERSLLQQLNNPLLGRRSSSGGFQQRCGIMRTCCKIPPTLLHHPNLAVGAGQRGQHVARLTGGSPMIQRPLQLTQSHQYQMLPSNHFVGPSPSHQLIRQDNQFQPMPMPMPIPMSSSSAMIQPTILDLAQQQQQQQRPPVGSFMAGRCGTKQTLGISGRVQNVQPAPGSEITAEFGEFPAHVAILKRLSPGDSLFVCSATLISNQWLATAAHCVRRHRPEELKVRLGEWDVNRDDEFYPFVESNIREIVVHPEFQASSLVNDIALLRMESPVDSQQMPHISPACLATPEDLFTNQRCWLAGWGKDAFGQQGSFQSTLKKVDLPVVGRQECESALRYQTKLGKFFRLHRSAICAGGERGKDACEGDGGAGLYCNEEASGLTKVVGLVSWGVGCGQRGVPGVYTNLALFYNWIENVISASGEESLYMDMNSNRASSNAQNIQGISDGAFKNLISERSNQQSLNGTNFASAETEGRSNNNNSNSNNSTSTTQTPSAVALPKELESRAG